MDSKHLQPFVIILCIAALLSGAGAWWYNKEFFVPNEASIARLQQELKVVKQARQAWEAALKKGQGENAVYESRFNYFTRQDIPVSRIQPYLLDEITPFFETHQLDFSKLSQGELTTEDNLQRITFTLSGAGRFRDIVALARWLEEEKYAVLTDFTITTPNIEEKESQELVKNVFKFDTSQRSTNWIAFQMSWQWVEGAPKKFISVVSPPQIENLTIGRDPFSSYAPKTIVTTENAEEELAIIYEAAPSDIHLSGIMEINGVYKALINDTYLETGMNYDKYHIIDIQENEMILGKENIRYRIRLERKQY
jgi:Tfp pilus assembly protein PilO